MRERWLRTAPDVGRIYATATPYVDDDPAESRHAIEYAQFVMANAAGRVLEVGSGAGGGGALIAQSCDLVMTDLSFERIAKARGPAPAMVADATALPIRSGTLDAVCSYQLFEHLTNPADALAEMARVTKPGGLVIAVGPNLLSPLHGARAAVVHLREGRLTRSDARRQRFFTGGNAVESAAIGVRNLMVLIATVVHPRFVVQRFRIPDFTPPACADSDAIWLATPTDLVRWASSLRLERESTKSRARVRIGRFAGSYWLLFRKR